MRGDTFLQLSKITPLMLADHLPPLFDDVPGQKRGCLGWHVVARRRIIWPPRIMTFYYFAMSGVGFAPFPAIQGRFVTAPNQPFLTERHPLSGI